MRSVLSLACAVSLLSASVASAETIQGQYLESRNASVWAGQCVINSEIGIAGTEATLAWKVNQGSFDNVQLDGLAVVAIVFGDRTFGIGDRVTTNTIFVVDESASAVQQTALIKMATASAGDTIQNVVKVKQSKISLEIADGGRSGLSILDAGIAKVRTRRLFRTDSLCGTKQTRMAYPPLAKVTDEQPAFTLESVYAGSEVDVKSFADRDVPSAVLAKFSL
jgi:hypothetical protein